MRLCSALCRCECGIDETPTFVDGLFLAQAASKTARVRIGLRPGSTVWNVLFKKLVSNPFQLVIAKTEHDWMYRDGFSNRHLFLR